MYVYWAAPKFHRFIRFRIHQLLHFTKLDFQHKMINSGRFQCRLLLTKNALLHFRLNFYATKIVYWSSWTAFSQFTFWLLISSIPNSVLKHYIFIVFVESWFRLVATLSFTVRCVFSRIFKYASKFEFD